MSTVNERFREVRKHYKYSQDQFSNDLGISRTHVSNIENGNDNPSLTLIKLVCVRFFVNEEWLVTGIGEMLSSTFFITTEQAIAKYNSVCSDFEKMLKDRKHEELEYTIESISCLCSLLTASKLEGNEKTEYLRKIHGCIDILEKTLHFIHSTSGILINKKSSSDSQKKYNEMCNSFIDNLIQNTKDAANIYLEKFGADIKW